jgi:hypothetical protein
MSGGWQAFFFVLLPVLGGVAVGWAFVLYREWREDVEFARRANYTLACATLEYDNPMKPVIPPVDSVIWTDPETGETSQVAYWNRKVQEKIQETEERQGQ